MKEKKVYDLVVIGAGASGLMAAIRAAEAGARVLLLERNSRPGVKLLLTGGGRCNLTNDIEEPAEFVERLGPGGVFLFSALTAFGPLQTVSFFNRLGLETVVESGGRVFPASSRAEDVLDVLSRALRKNGVDIRLGTRVREVAFRRGRVEKLLLDRNRQEKGSRYLFATGGLSFPVTGSTGDGYEWARRAGHRVKDLLPSLVPVIVRENVKELEGLSLKNVSLSLCLGGRKLWSGFGEAVFTENGLSGPVPIDLSRLIARSLPAGLGLEIDFKPALDVPRLDRRVRSDLREHARRVFRNSLDGLLPRRMIPVIVRASGIDPEKKAGDVSREERHKLVGLLKGFPLTVGSLAGFNRAVTTAGGVELSEVDQKTMRSKIVDNLYFSGEMLDIDGPTGGYNLQVAWTTGFAVGDAVAGRLARSRQPSRKH